MAGPTNRYDARPRPVGQSLWLLATMAVAAIVVASIGGRLSADLHPGPAAAVDAATLLDLASLPAGAEPGVPPGAVAPSAPLLTEHEVRGRAALAEISYPWEQLLPEWTISFLPEQQGLYGLTLVPEKRIEIYVRPDQTTELLSHVIAHELGHAVDVTFNDGPDRRAWEESRQLAPSAWWPGDGATDFSTGAGDFAESFAAWQTDPHSFRSTLAGPPTDDQIQLLAELSTG